MSAKITLCDECRLDNGWHYPEDGEPYRPHLQEAKAASNALRVVELAHEQQTKQARDIVKWAAECMLEFSANNVRLQMADAGIEGPVVGAAFKWAETEGLIEATGRSVQSTDPATRHRINVWRSLHMAARLGVGA